MTNGDDEGEFEPNIGDDNGGAGGEGVDIFFYRQSWWGMGSPTSVS